MTGATPSERTKNVQKPLLRRNNHDGRNAFDGEILDDEWIHTANIPPHNPYLCPVFSGIRIRAKVCGTEVSNLRHLLVIRMAGALYWAITVQSIRDRPVCRSTDLHDQIYAT